MSPTLWIIEYHIKKVQITAQTFKELVLDITSLQLFSNTLLSRNGLVKSQKRRRSNPQRGWFAKIEHQMTDTWIWIKTIG